VTNDTVGTGGEIATVQWKHRTGDTGTAAMMHAGAKEGIKITMKITPLENGKDRGLLTARNRVANTKKKRKTFIGRGEESTQVDTGVDEHTPVSTWALSSPRPIEVFLFFFVFATLFLAEKRAPR